MSDPDHTAARLIAAAERLFAEGGEQATSLRAITREARSNAAAVHYHFGGRDELLRAVLDRHLGPLAQRRARLLELARIRDGDPLTVPAVIEAAIRPDLELLASLRVGQVQVARLLGRAHTLPGEAVGGLVRQRFEEFVQQVQPALRPALPGLDEAELRSRLRLVVATVLFAFATAPDPDPLGALASPDVDEQLNRLVAFCAAGVAAPTARGRVGPRSPGKVAAKRVKPSAKAPAGPSAKPSTRSPAKPPAKARARSGEIAKAAGKTVEKGHEKAADKLAPRTTDGVAEKKRKKR